MGNNIGSFIFIYVFVLLYSCGKPTHLNSSGTIMPPVWQWCVPMDGFISPETNGNPEAYLWVPENCEMVKGVVFTQNNMIEEGMLEDPDFRDKMRKLGFAEVWVTPMFAQKFDMNTEEPALFQHLMQKLSLVSGYNELSGVPVVPMGHSALATYPWNFAAWAPGRTLAVISIHGDAPQTDLTGYGGANVDWGNRGIDGIPGLFVMGEYEWWEDRLAPGFKFQQEHPGSVITWLADAGHGHFDYSQMLIKYVADYIQKAAEYRLSDEKGGALRKIRPTDGWLMDRWRMDSLPQAVPAPYEVYTGYRKVASWVFDQQMAKETEAYYAKARGKIRQYIGLKQNGNVLLPANSHTGYDVKFNPLNDGITFHVSAFFADSTHLKTVEGHANTPLRIDKITGPVKKINDTTFQLSFDKLGFDNQKRSNNFWLLANNMGDEHYKSTVQQMQVRFPLQNKEGELQTIDFPQLEDQENHVKAILLKAKSSRNAPVHYYVKSGPAYIDGDSLVFTAIPPKARYPVEVTVVAWQYGKAGILQSAEPVMRKLLITNY